MEYLLRTLTYILFLLKAYLYQGVLDVVGSAPENGILIATLTVQPWLLTGPDPIMGDYL